MKPKLKGNLAELYAQKKTLRRTLASGEYVEYIHKSEYSLQHNSDGATTFVKVPSYSVEICGVNKHNVEIRGGLRGYESDGGKYFWQIANSKAVRDVLENPEHAYDYSDVCNGIAM